MARRVTAEFSAVLVPLLLLLATDTAQPVGSGPAPVAPRVRTPVAPRSAEADYNAGLRAKAARQYAAAVSLFQRAVDARPDFPEAWNELGFALRQTGKYEEALAAYDRALNLRPDFPEAMEYLGEAYVKLGRLDDARAVLERLKRLDVARAQELDEVIRAAR
jgi:tetratricopeptide (TPR) repeat protein